MPRTDDDDEIEEDGDDPENPDISDMDEESDWEAPVDTIECPWCGEEIAEEAEWCTHCGKYISKEDAPAIRKPIWILIGLVFVVLIVIALIFK